MSKKQISLSSAVKRAQAVNRREFIKTLAAGTGIAAFGLAGLARFTRAVSLRLGRSTRCPGNADACAAGYCCAACPQCPLPAQARSRNESCAPCEFRGQ